MSEIMFDNFKNLRTQTQDNISDRMTFFIFITERCNLKCKYCFIDKGAKSIEFNDFVIAFVRFKAAFPNIRRYMFSFYGGEPLCEFETLKMIVEYIKTEHSDIESKFAVTTNGTIMNNHIACFLIKHKVNISISIDGPEYLHNSSRLFPDGSGSHSQLLSNLSIIDKNKVSYSAKCTISKPEHLPIVYNYLKSDLNIAQFEISEIVGQPLFLDSIDQLESYESAWRKIIDQELICMSGGGRWALTKIKNLLLRMVAGKSCFCGAGQSMVCVGIDGNYYPCYRASEYPELCLGVELIKGTNNGFNKVVSDLSSMLCLNCISKSLCGGGCYINQYKYRELFKQFNIECELNKMYCRLSEYLYERLSTLDNGLTKFLTKRF